jgi:hypothetical protein
LDGDNVFLRNDIPSAKVSMNIEALQELKRHHLGATHTRVDLNMIRWYVSMIEVLCSFVVHGCCRDGAETYEVEPKRKHE